MTTYTIDIQQFNGSWYTEVVATADEAYALVCAIDDAAQVEINNVNVSSQEALEAWYAGQKVSVDPAEVEKYIEREISDIKTAIQGVMNNLVKAMVTLEFSPSFTVTRMDTDYTSVPTGHIEGLAIMAFIREWDIELESCDGDSVIVRAEWGNGEGFDHYRITPQN